MTFNRGAREIIYRQLDRDTSVPVDVGGDDDSEGTLGGAAAAVLTNKSGADRPKGSVVVVDPDNEESFELATGDAQTAHTVGVLLEDIAANARGLVQIHGYNEHVQTSGAVAIGDKLFTDLGAVSATASATRATGAFAEALTDDAGTSTNLLLDLAEGSLKVFSEDLPNNPKTNAVDGDDATVSHWSADAADGVAEGYIAADLGSSMEVERYRVKQGYSNDPSAEPEGADEMILYGSDEGTAWAWLTAGALADDPEENGWQEVATFSGDRTGSDSGEVTLDSTATFRYWLLRASEGPSAGDGDGWNVQEWELWDSAGFVSAILWGQPDPEDDAGGGGGNVLAVPTGSTVQISGLALGDRQPASAGTYDEEFDGTADTLPSSWAWTAAPSGSDTWKLNSRWPSLLTVEGTGNTTYTLTRSSVTAASTFGIWGKFHLGPLTAADVTQVRMYVSNSGDSEQRGVNWRATGAQAAGARGLKIISSVESAWTTEVAPGFVTHLYMGMTRDSNNWTMWISNDGVSWIMLNNSAQAHTLTVDKMRFQFRTSTVTSMVAIDWIRYRADGAFPRP